MSEGIREFLLPSSFLGWSGLVLAVIALLVFLPKILLRMLCAYKDYKKEWEHIFKGTEPALVRPSLLSYFIFIALVITFAGFAYMHYNTIGPGQPPFPIVSNNSTVHQPLARQDCIRAGVKPEAPPPGQADSDTRIKLFETMLSNNDRATNRVFALVTVLVAVSTLIVALQFIVNTRMMKDFEDKKKEFEDDLEEVKGKKSEIAKMHKEIAEKYINILPMEDIAKRGKDKLDLLLGIGPAQSYPYRISFANLPRENIFCSINNVYMYELIFLLATIDDTNTKNDWNTVFLLAKLVKAEVTAKEKQGKIRPCQKHTPCNLDTVLIVSSLQAEIQTDSRREKEELLGYAIDRLEERSTKDIFDQINIASAYARRAMLFPRNTDSEDYDKADKLFNELNPVLLGLDDSDHHTELKTYAYYNRGVSHLARVAQISRKEEGNSTKFELEVEHAKEFFEEANNLKEKNEKGIADYALLSLYSLTKNYDACKNAIKQFVRLTERSEYNKFLPSPYRIDEDTDLDYLRNEQKELYKELYEVARKNDHLKPKF